MRKSNFDYQGARQAGYSDEEISQHLSQVHPDFDYQGAVQSGYSPQEINEHLSNYKPERSLLEQGGRLAAQVGLGAASMAALPYEVAVAPLGIPGGQETMGDLFTRDILNDVYPTEEEGRAPRDTIFSQPERELAEPIDLSIRGLAEKATGVDLHPEGFLEKAANWIGFIKDPKQIIKAGLKPKELLRAIAPTGEEALRGIGAGAALQAAEEGDFGPIGTMAALVVGDLAGGKVADLGKQAKELITKPKQTLANVAARFTSAEKKALQQDIIKDFRDAGIQADLGTITDNNLIKWTQSRLIQSGLSGKDLSNLKERTTQQIKEQYKALADSLGEAKYTTQHEAGQIAKEALTRARDEDLSRVRNIYQQANQSLGRRAFVGTSGLNRVIDDLEKKLKPGQIKSSEQQAVLDVLRDLKRDVRDSSGSAMGAEVKDLMNNKIAIQDKIDYEVQGGAKQLLKQVVKELDKAIISHGKDNATFAKNYIKANRDFAQHAKTFRNKNVNNMLNSADPSLIMNKMNTVQGIKDLEKAFKSYPEGKKVFDSLKRNKLDEIIGNNLIDSTTQQVKLGTFSKLLEKGKNREVIKEILGSKAFKRLEKLQKNAGKLAEAADKFYNASKSGAVAVDAAIIADGMKNFAHLLYGNPWPLLRTGAIITGGRQLSKLMADPEFLKLVEEAILSSEKGSQQQLIQSFERLAPYFLETKNISSPEAILPPEVP